MRNFEIKTIEHNGIKVIVEIDYDAGKWALVSRDSMDDYNPKEWVFAGRSLEYMSSWLDIIEAMRFAVIYIKNELKSHEEEKNRPFNEVVKGLSEGVAKIDRGIGKVVKNYKKKSK